MYSGQKAEYYMYVTILSGKNYLCLIRLSTAEQFVSSFLTSAGSDLHMYSYTQNAQGLNRT